MTILHVGGFTAIKNRYKSLESAIDNARIGDTILLHKSQSINGVVIDKDVIIDGNNASILTSEQNSPGLIINANVKIQNLKIAIKDKANGLYLKENCHHLSIENSSLYYDKKIDPRDWYSSIFCESDCKVNLDISYSTVLYLNTLFESIMASHSSFGLMFGMMSWIEVSSNSDFSHCDLNNVSLNFSNLIVDFCKSDSTLSLMGISSEAVCEISNFAMNKTKYESKEFTKSFKDKALYKDNFDGLVLQNGNYDVDGLTDNNIKSVYDIYGLSVVDSKVTLKNATLSLSYYASKSSIEDFSDASWDSNDSTIKTPKTIGSGASDAFLELQRMIGLEDAKNQLQKFLATAKIKSEQSRRGIVQNASFGNHMVFSGPAGTGKTTVANILSKALADEGVLKDAKVTVVGAKDLVSKWVGETKNQTHNVIKSALGGILFIDEAYSLLPRGESNHEQDAVDQIVEDAMKYKDDLIIILAGYEQDMRNFIDTANAGLKSRFTHWIKFTPYSFEDLVNILIYNMKKSNTKISRDTMRLLCVEFLKIYQRDASVDGLDGNGRYVENLLRDLFDARNNRLANLGSLSDLSDDDLLTITDEDVYTVFKNK